VGTEGDTEAVRIARVSFAITLSVERWELDLTGRIA